MDAPWHFHSTTDSGARPAPSIDEAPLDLFFRAGVKLDFSNRPAGHVVSAAEVDAELARIGHDLRPFDIVLVQSGAIYGTDNFTDQGCGMGRSEEHTSELQSLMRISYAVLCLKK